MSPNQPPAKENTTDSNDAVSSNLRPRKTIKAAKEKPTDRINHDLQQLSNNNGRTRSGSSSTSSSRRSNGKQCLFYYNVVCFIKCHNIVSFIK